MEKRRQLMVQFENYREKKEEEFAMYKERRLALRNGNHLLFAPHPRGYFACFFFQFLSSADFFQKVLSGTPPECQTVWIQIRSDILSGLVWVQTVCKGYQR